MTSEHQAGGLFRRGEFEAAARAYLTLAERHPERLDIQARLGQLDLLANHPEAAIARLAAVLEHGLRTREILAHLAEAYYRRGELGPAALCYQQLGREGLAGTLAAMTELDILRPADPRAGCELAWLAGDPLPVVPAAINGETANLVLDSGAGDTVLDLRFAVDAGVRLGGQEWRSFAGGQPARVTHGHAAQLDLGGLHIHDLPVQMIDLHAVFGDWFPDLPIHGILGVGVMSLFNCTLDYRRRLLRLAPADGAAASAGGVPLWLGENRMPLSRADFPGRPKALVFLDSGMTGGAFAVSRTRAPKLGVAADARAPLLGRGGGGHVHGDAALAARLRLDRLARRDAHGLLLEGLSLETAYGYRIDGLIGHDMLRGARLTLDFANSRLHALLEGADHPL